MPLDLAAIKAHCNVTLSVDDALLQRLLGAASAKIGSDLGYSLTDTDELPDGPPADLEHAVLMTVAHWYENREASIVGVSATTLPIGVADIVSNYRRYSFGVTDDE